jgi:hypothetical protein
MIDEETAVSHFTQMVKRYAQDRAQNVERGLETPRLAALLVQKYGRGVVDAIIYVFDNARAADPVWRVLDAETAKIDPDWRAHDRDRWEGRPADLVTNNKLEAGN